MNRILSKTRVTPRVGLVVIATALLFFTGSAHAEEFPEAAVATDHPLASQVGAEIMKSGGNAADAAVATGLTLGVLNPFASGLGGGGFLVYYDAESERSYALNFREPAPSAATRDMFVGEDGEVDREIARHGGLAVAVPAELQGWWELHQRFGSLPWQVVCAAAIRHAGVGHEVGSLLPERLASFEENAESWPALRDAFLMEDGEFPEQGDILERPELAQLLLSIAEHGPEAFYEGEIADAIVEAVQQHGGILSQDDLRSVSATWEEPITVDFEGRTMVGMGLPSSGGIVMGMVLKALSHFHLDRVRPLSPIWIHVVTEMMIHAFADRAHAMGDAEFVDQGPAYFLSEERIGEMVSAYRPTTTLEPRAYGPLIGTDEDAGTSHFSIVDPEGNAVSVTTTINTSFGSYVYVPEAGIVLNNEMNDFSAQPGVPNAFGLVGSEANAIEPGKQPLSSMSPTLILEDGEVIGALGGSGGPKIISGTLLTLLHLTQGAASTEAAIEYPRFHHQWMPDELEVDTDIEEMMSRSLAAYGYTVVPARWSASVQAIWRRGDVWDASSDSAKHGEPAGF